MPRPSKAGLDFFSAVTIDDAAEDPGEELHDLMLRGRRLLRAFRRAARRGRLTTDVRTKLRSTLEGLIAQLEALADEA